MIEKLATWERKNDASVEFVGAFLIPMLLIFAGWVVLIYSN